MSWYVHGKLLGLDVFVSFPDEAAADAKLQSLCRAANELSLTDPAIRSTSRASKVYDIDFAAKQIYDIRNGMPVIKTNRMPSPESAYA